MFQDLFFIKNLKYNNLVNVVSPVSDFLNHTVLQIIFTNLYDAVDLSRNGVSTAFAEAAANWHN